MRAIFGCRIDLRVSMKVRSAGLRPALALLLDTLGKMRGGAPRSNLQAPVCMRRIDPSSRHSGRACAIRNLGAESASSAPGFRAQCSRIPPDDGCVEGGREQGSVEFSQSQKSRFPAKRRRRVEPGPRGKPPASFIPWVPDRTPAFAGAACGRQALREKCACDPLV